MFDVVAVAPTRAAATLAVATLFYPLARRSWAWATTLLVAAYALAWTWVSWLQTPASVAYWGAFLALMAWWLPTLALRRARPWLVAVFLCVGLLAASVFWSIDARHTALELARFMPVLLVAALVADAAARPENRIALVNAFAVLSPAVVVASLLTAALLGDEIPSQLGGISGIFNAPNYFGLFLALTFPFFLAHPRVAATPVASLTSTAVAGYLVALSAGRAGLLALAVALLVSALARQRWLYLSGSLLCLTLAVALAVTWSPTIPTFGQQTGLIAGKSHASETAGRSADAGQLLGGDRPPGQSRLSALLGARDEAWRESLRILERRPVLGNGFGTGTVLFDHYGSRERFTYFVGAFGSGQGPHNSYIQAVLELGLVGCAVLLLPLALAGGCGLWLVVRGDADSATIAFCASLAALLAAALFESLFANAGAVTLLGWIVAGGVLGTAASQVGAARGLVATSRHSLAGDG